MRIESTKPHRVVDEWEIAAITFTRTHTTLHQGPDAQGRQQNGLQLEGVLHFEVGARVRMTVEEVPAAVAIAAPPTELSARPPGLPAATGPVAPVDGAV